MASSAPDSRHFIFCSRLGWRPLHSIIYHRQDPIGTGCVNLYSITTNQTAIIALFRVINSYVGNLSPMPRGFPTNLPPVVRNAGAERELTMMRWDMPPPPKFGGPPVTKIRAHWRGWVKPESRRLVPVNSFVEYAPEPNPETKKKDVVWFALNDNRPLFAFAGIWTEFKGDRGAKSKPIPGPHDVYGFLTSP
jgi:putative SOS response-associated peptidase YedK